MEPIFAWISHYGYAALFGALMFGIAGLPIPDETILLFSGYLIATGRFHTAPTVLTALAGSVAGITLSYVIGRTAGQAAIYHFGRYVRITPKHIDKAHDWFRRIGNWTLTFGYYVPGVRHFTALAAGMSRLEYPIFAIYAYAGAVIWVVSFLLLGYYFGANWRKAADLAHRYGWWTVGLIAGAAFAAWLLRKWNIQRK